MKKSPAFWVDGPEDKLTAGVFRHVLACDISHNLIRFAANCIKNHVFMLIKRHSLLNFNNIPRLMLIIFKVKTAVFTNSYQS